MKPLVIVRAQPAASATARAARQIGLEPIVAPLFALEPVGWSAPDARRFDGLLFTSANALRFGGDELRSLVSLPAHCVGEATAEVARELGFCVECVGGAGVDALLTGLAPNLRLLHLCGVDRRSTTQVPQAITPVAVYRAVELAPPESFDSVADAVIAAHSPRSAAVVARVARQRGLALETIVIAAISKAAAEAAGEGWKAVKFATAPSDSALLALAAQLCNKP